MGFLLPSQTVRYWQRDTTLESEWHLAWRIVSIGSGQHKLWDGIYILELVCDSALG